MNASDPANEIVGKPDSLVSFMLHTSYQLIAQGWRYFLALALTSCLIVGDIQARADEPSSSKPEHPISQGTQVRVAAISLVPKKFDLAGNADRLEEAFRKCREGGAMLAVAPEGVLEGYVVNEIIGGEAAVEKMNDVAAEIDSPVVDRFQKLARELRMCLVFGFAERIDNDVYNCALFIDHEGNICGKQHKMQFAEGYHPSWWFNRLGEHNRAFDTPLGRCGVLICNDRWNADLARIPALDGAQFLVIPAYGSRSLRNDEAVLSRGRENSIPVVEANVGVSLIVSQNEIAAVDRAEEGITFATITIPPPREASPEARDAQEETFLKWRAEEMVRRYEAK